MDSAMRAGSSEARCVTVAEEERTETSEVKMDGFFDKSWATVVEQAL